MPNKKSWRSDELKKLVDNCAVKTIQELMVMFPGRSQESINNKIKRLKIEGKIKGGKDKDTIKRAYEQRSQDVFITVDQVTQQ